MSSKNIGEKLMSSMSSSTDNRISSTVHLNLPNVLWRYTTTKEEGRFSAPDNHGVQFISNLRPTAPLTSSSHSTSTNMSLSDQVPNHLNDGNMETSQLEVEPTMIDPDQGFFSLTKSGKFSKHLVKMYQPCGTI